MSLALSRCVQRVLFRHTVASRFLLGEQSPLFAPALTLKTAAPLRGDIKVKKRVDPKRDFMVKERMKKKMKKLEKVPAEFIPVEDFSTPLKCLEESRGRSAPRLSFEETEQRALLSKEWNRYKQKQYMTEKQAVELALEAQREALKELRLESEELYRAALKPDPLLFPFSQEGPTYTPPKSGYDAPDGKYNDITKVYTQ
ncbi:large ribosomal subunit protein mL40-like [Brachionichthys hirsutus]|uniref:large ribosomal subunit protein mL40-like n=1 Tax=Brachionichthys hirsutus TaxID=412623 RepID=UPI003604EDDD